MKRYLAITVALLAQVTNADTLIHAGRLIDGDSSRTASEATIRIDDSTIVAVHRGYATPSAGDTVIDLSGYTVLPGLMDTHVHLTGQSSPQSRLNRFIHNEADLAFLSAKYAKITLESGFTVVRNLGDAFGVTVALRKAIERGDVPGPMIITAAKSIGSTGGHADPTNGWASHLVGEPSLLKITATGGVLSVAKSGQAPQFTDEELRAIVDTAADYGLRVAAHAHGTEGMRRAVAAGVASIEHGTYMSDDIMEMMRDRGTYHVPTLVAGAWVAEKAKIDDFFPEIVRPKAAAIGPVMIETFARSYKAGVPIVFGTDSGVNPHGTNAEEFALMVQGGMPEMEAIRSATSVAADFLGIGETHGTITVGKQADIVAVSGNPLQDISVLTDVSFVMKAGVVYVGPGSGD
jgi:imidazolonepropionase-like amidohydrolase